MEEKEKICPMTWAKNDGPYKCREDACAWWIENPGQCGIRCLDWLWDITIPT